MKNLRQFFAVATLTLVLTFSAFAGDIQFPGDTNPPRPEQQSSVTVEAEFPGASATGDMSDPGLDALDPVTEAILGLLRNLLTFF